MNAGALKQASLDTATADTQLNTAEYAALRALIKSTTGIQLAEDRQQMIRRRLSSRLKELQLTTFTQYLDILQSGDAIELELFANAVTTNLTAFFREDHHFQFLSDTLLPQLVEMARNHHRKIRIWSAGCSTGEEAYSIAMSINEMNPLPSDLDIKILASDLDSGAVAHAAAGIYTCDRLAKMSAQRRKRWFTRGTGVNKGHVRIDPHLQQQVTFRHLNLLQPWPMKNQFDVIFCRNTIIYFDKTTQKELVGRFTNALSQGGHLILGHSESLMYATDKLSLLGKTIYKRVS